MASKQSEFRIIGGQWRSRRLPFANEDGLRPTLDRVRETVFNWLAEWTPGARVLDAFAGSGSLGIEALSRGASQVTFVDQSRDACDYIQKNLDTLKASDSQVVCSDVEKWVAVNESALFDLIFLDPPFGRGLIAPLIEQLMQAQCVGPETLIYTECESGGFAGISGFQKYKAKKFRSLEVAVWRRGD